MLRAAIGERSNRRHRPGRAFERTAYRFDVLTDYGAFRDLQRHRLLTIDWQGLTPRHGYNEPEAVAEAGVLEDWRQVVEASADLHDAVAAAGWKAAAAYAVAMAYRVRFYMDMNAREAMHVIELRTAPQGHPAYRRVCQEMHRLIADQAGHRAIAAAMQFADHSDVELERLGSERALERKRGAGGSESGVEIRPQTFELRPANQHSRHRGPHDSRLFRLDFLTAPVAAELFEKRQRLERLHAIEEQHAIEVIGLVLDHARGEA